MKFFIDTADVREIREARETGLLDGVTTNPSLIAKTGRGFREVVEEICELVDGPVSIEATSLKAEELTAEGRDIARLSRNAVVKVPLTKDGLKATRALSQDGIPVNVTLCFSATQALLAAKAGATYVSPFVGRLDDRSQVGMDLIRDIKQIYDNYSFKTQILVASVRHPIHVLEAALVGAHVATVPLAVFESLVRHPLTDLGIEQFLKDWAKVPKEASKS